jgi:N utilization substance protein B
VTLATPDETGVERHRAREAALQLLYQWEVGRIDQAALDEANESYWDGHPGPKLRRTFAEALVVGTTGHLDTIDPLLEASADNWRLSRMAVVDRLIMRLAVYELLYTGTPSAVVINEALELGKTFGGDHTVRFVNGVLDSISRSLQSGDLPRNGEGPRTRTSG